MNTSHAAKYWVTWLFVATFSIALGAAVPFGLIAYGNSKLNSTSQPDGSPTKKVNAKTGELDQPSVSIQNHFLAQIPEPNVRRRLSVLCAENKDTPNDYKLCIEEGYHNQVERKIFLEGFQKKPSPPPDGKNSSSSNSSLGLMPIGILLCIAFTQSVTFFDCFRVYRGHKRLFGVYDAWLVDAPPLLGICGTLFALISFLGGVSTNSGIDNFLSAFSVAALTTLAGGFASVLNQFFLSSLVRRD